VEIRNVGMHGEKRAIEQSATATATNNQTNPFDSLQYDECTQQANNKTEIIPQFRFHID